MEVKFRKFDPSTIREYSTVLFAGGRRTGKSFCMRDFLYHMRKKIYDCRVFSGTMDEDHLWTKYTPQRLVHYCMEEFPMGVLKKAISTQEKRKTIAREHGVQCPASMILFEDVEHLQPSIWNDQAVRTLVFNGRFPKLYCFVAFQYIMEIKMGLRGSFDYCVFAMENSAAVRDRIWKQFGGIFPTFAEFEAVFFECTKDYRVMVIDCRSRSYNLEDTVFWYRARDRGYFHVGHPSVWHVDTEDSDEELEKKRSLIARPRKSRLGAAAYKIKLNDVDDEEEEQADKRHGRKKTKKQKEVASKSNTNKKKKKPKASAAKKYMYSSDEEDV